MHKSTQGQVQGLQSCKKASLHASPPLIASAHMVTELWQRFNLTIEVSRCGASVRHELPVVKCELPSCATIPVLLPNGRR